MRLTFYLKLNQAECRTIPVDVTMKESHLDAKTTHSFFNAQVAATQGANSGQDMVRHVNTTQMQHNVEKQKQTELKQMTQIKPGSI